MSAGLLAIAATNENQVGTTGYPASTVVRFEASTFRSSNQDHLDAATVISVASGTTGQLYVRVSGSTPTRYQLAVWLLDASSTPTSPDPSFDIELRFVGTAPSASQRDAIRAAADGWERIISSGLTSLPIVNSRWTCRTDDPSPFGDFVDDLRVYIRLASIDGPRGTIAAAGPCVTRGASGNAGLPVIGSVTFDSDDLPRLSNPVLQRFAVHELGHALGFGAGPRWRSLLENPSVSSPSIASVSP